MTLLGKIITVLIFILSLMFMSFSVMVFVTHKNWRELVMNEELKDGKDLGLKFQVEQKEAFITGLQKKIDKLNETIRKERAARRGAIAALNTKNLQQETLLTQKEAELNAAKAAHDLHLQEMQRAQDLLLARTKESEQLRNDILAVQLDRDAQLKRVVDLTETTNGLMSVESRLTERANQLVDQVTSMKKVMDAHGLTENSDVDNIPPQIDGLVTAVGASDFVEISVGQDDGIAIGHEFHVYRDRSYLGKLVVRKTSPNRAVAQIIKEQQRGPIKKGDRVATKLS